MVKVVHRTRSFINLKNFEVNFLSVCVSVCQRLSNGTFINYSTPQGNRVCTTFIKKKQKFASLLYLCRSLVKIRHPHFMLYYILLAPRLVHRLHWYDFVIFFKNEENLKKIEKKLLYILTYIIWLYNTRKINFNIFFLHRF